jgi:Domain of unknown function (DUF4157)
MTNRASILMNGGHTSRSTVPAAGKLRRCGQAVREDYQVDPTLPGRTAVNSVQISQDRVPEIVHDVLRSPGQPLTADARAFFEPRFGHDFSHVRIHSDAKAGRSARAVDALAYTVGRDIVIGVGNAPIGTVPWELLAHELVHVLQQSQDHRPVPNEVSTAVESAAERHADRAALAIGAGMRLDAEQRYVSMRLQKVGMEDDSIHRPLIEGFRREHGLPPGEGRPGERIGPSDAEIKYRLAPREVQLTHPPPARLSVTATQARELAKRPLPANVSVGNQPPARSAGPTPRPGSSPSRRAPQPQEATELGVDIAADTSWSAQLSLVARHWDMASFHRGGVTIDVLHEPSASLALSVDQSSLGMVTAQVAVTGLNLVFRAHGREFIELGLAQLGLALDSRGELIWSTGAQIEVHSPKQWLSFVLSTSGTATHKRDGSVDLNWSPITFGVVFHVVNP